MVSAVVVVLAASACGGSGSSDDPLADVDGTEVFDRLVEAVAGSDQVFHVIQTEEGSSREQEIWLAPGGVAARQHTYQKEDLDSVSVWADGLQYYYNIGHTLPHAPSPEGQFDAVGLYALRYLRDMSYFDELDVRSTTYNGEGALEISGDYTDVTLDLPDLELSCTGETSILVKPESLVPIRQEGHGDCGEGDEAMTPRLYIGAEFVPLDSLPEDWFRADNLQDQVVSSQFEEAKKLGFPLHTFGSVDGAVVNVQHVSISSGTFRGEFPIAMACYEPDGDPPDPYDEWPLCTVDLWQYDATHFEPDRCDYKNKLEPVELENGISAERCFGGARRIDFEDGETSFSIRTSSGRSSGREINPYNNDEGIIALANSIVPLP